MGEPKKDSRAPVTRRDFLTLATAGATLAVAGSDSSLLASSRRAGQLGYWQAGRPVKSVGITLLKGPESKWTLQEHGGVELSYLPPSRDYYTRAAFLAKIGVKTSAPAWLVVEYLDRGYDLISVYAGSNGPRPTPWTRQWNVARLNTGRLRKAVIRIDPPAFESPSGSRADAKPNVRITGIRYLRSITLLDAKPEIEPVPQVEPVLHFNGGFQRDINITVDSPLGQEAEGVAVIRNMAPLVRALGFNAVESYVQWNYVERQPGGVRLEPLRQHRQRTPEARPQIFPAADCGLRLRIARVVLQGKRPGRI